ncbi:MAG TPA: hypothetical protein VGR26_09590, partial [Acidimicrobiales bacterium]|nr:hypothetical protein [Acidimicrobiales bacterium]
MPRVLTALIACLAALAFVAAPASAGHDGNPSPKVATYTYDVDPVPHPGTDRNEDVSGTVRIRELPNRKLQVKVRISGL